MTGNEAQEPALPEIAAGLLTRPEFFAGGAKLVGISGLAGKITAEAFAETLARYPRGLVKASQPGALSLSQATEAGTLYTLAEIAKLASLAHEAGIGVHMDGARFANAIVRLNATPADMTWRAGVDVLSFGATKNGALACEAVVFFDPVLAAQFDYRGKQAGQLASKMRFLAAQFQALLTDELWLRNARRANAMAARLALAVRDLPGLSITRPVQTTAVFATLPAATSAALQKDFAFHVWDQDSGEVRWMCAWDTDEEDVDAFAQAMRDHLA